ncbi:thymidylate kinase [Euwallacea fornicatus]|uniref:thymidylate kinase n=1 Tax=Euwallacea fornicatus TaxID=995702 RepID=UPI00338FD7AC
MRSLSRGALIVIEGVDRSGKSTQCRKLVESLRAKNLKTELMNFPDRTTLTGKLISEYLKNRDCELNDQAIHLLFSANRWENVEKMKSLLNSGTTLIVDRYSYSGIAFSAAKGVTDISWCKQPENGLPKPDLVFLLMLSHEEAASRNGFGEERYENETMQRNVTNVFMQLAKDEDNWKVVDANNSVESLHEVLLEGVLNKVSEVSLKDLQTLQFNS